MPPSAPDSRTILGLKFFQGTAKDAVRRAQAGGLVIIPAAPALKDLATNLSYRQALADADVLLTDSAYMVVVWNWLQKDRVSRLSGLRYLRELLDCPDFRQSGNTLWVMANPEAVAQNIGWLSKQGIDVPESHIYIAPIYPPPVPTSEVIDPVLVEMIERLRPQHVVLTIGGGSQEPLGHNLKQHLSYLPAIHCIGAAIAFLSGDQVLIPVWADTYYLGWLFRILSEPSRFAKRYWEARKLYALLDRYRDRMPDFIA